MQTQNNSSLQKKNTHSSLLNKTFIEELYTIGVVQFGQFKLKSGIVAPIYLDLRRIISYPHVMEQVIQAMGKIINECDAHSICGVPYAGIPLATGVALFCKKPMIMPRKEAKTYGAKKSIEGVYNNGDTTIIIEDIMTTGSSIKETYQTLITNNLHVNDVVVFCDRRTQEQQEKTPYTIHALYTLNEIVDHLHTQGKINVHTYQSIQQFLNA